MNRGVWVGAVAMGLGGMLAESSGQDAVWRPVQRPPAPAIVRAVSADAAGASLGRPVPISRGASAESDPPRPFPSAYQSGIPLSPAPVSSDVELIATVPPPGSVIACSGARSSAIPAEQPAAAPVPVAVEHAAEHAEADEPGSGELFAADRRNYPPGQFMGAVDPKWMPGATIVPVANWTEKYPAVPPEPAAPPAPLAQSLQATPPPPPRFYLGAEYLLWWVRPDHAPPLVTTGDAQNGQNVQAGALGQASTVILDNGRLTSNPFSGGRFWAGFYLDDCGDKAIEFGGFFLGQRSENFTASSAQYPVLTRPFFDLNQNIPLVERIAFPGISSGSATVNSPSNLWGLQANMLCNLCCGCDYSVNVLGGFRFLSLREGVTITEDIQAMPGLPDPFNGTHFQVTDSFATNNQFYGGQVGLNARWWMGPFTVDGFAKLALGVTDETLDVNGAFHFPPGTPNVDPRPGGLLALNSNIGHFTRNQFSVVPEVGLKLGYFITDNIRATVGYNFLYWSNVVRPGEQIDTNIDITRIPNFTAPAGTTPLPTPHPAVIFRDTDLWAQGITFGLEFIY